MINAQIIALAKPEDAEVGIIILLLILSTSFGIYKYYNRPKAKVFRNLKKSPAKAVYNAKEGEYFRIHGTVLTGDEMLEAALSGRKCVCYHAKARERQGKNESWSEEFNYQHFSIKSGSDIAHICPGSKSVIQHYIKIDIKSTAKPHKFPKTNIRRFMAKYHISEHYGLLSAESDIDFFEAVVAPGERISVKGIAKWKTDAKTNRRFLELHGSYDKPVVISDDPKSLKILSK